MERPGDPRLAERLKEDWLAAGELELAEEYGAPVSFGAIDWHEIDDETAGIIEAVLEDRARWWDADPHPRIRAYVDECTRRQPRQNEIEYVPVRSLAKLLAALLAEGVTPPVTDAVADESELVKALRAQTGVLTAELDAYRREYGTAIRRCACGCGQPVTSPRPEARYATGACRVRAHRAAEARKAR